MMSNTIVEGNDTALLNNNVTKILPPPQEKLTTNTENKKNILEVNNASDITSSTTVFVNDDGALHQIPASKLRKSQVDSTLTKTGYAADAKITGDKINALTQNLNQAKTELSDDIKETESNLTGIKKIDFVNTKTFTGTTYGNAIPLQIEGFIRQETTTGAQLFDISRASLAGGNAKYKIINDNTIEITGEKSMENRYSNVNFSLTYLKNQIQGKKLYLYCKFSGSHQPQGQIAVTPTSGNVQYIPILSDRWAEADVPNECENIIFGLYPTTEPGTTDTVTFSNIKIGLSQFDTQEPYTGGQPAPNPDYPMVVQGTGAYNFWDGRFEDGAYNSVTGNPETGTNYIRCIHDIIYPLKSGDKIKFIYEKPVNIGICLFDKQGVLTYSSSSLSSEWEYITTKNQEKFRFFILDKDGVNTETAKHLTITINDKYAIAVKSKSVNLKPPTTVFLWNCEQSFYGDTDVIKSTLASTATGEVSYGQYRIGEYRELASKTIYVKRNGSLVNQTIYTVTGDHTIKQVVNPSSTGKYTIPTGIDADHVDILLYTAIGKTTELERMCVSLSPDVDYVPYYENATYIPVDYPLFEGDKIVQRNGEYKLVRKWGYAVFDGSEDESWGVTYISTYRIYNSYIDLTNPGKKSSYVVCDRFDSVGLTASDSYVDNNAFISGSGKFNLMTSPDRSEINGTESLKTWLRSNPVTVVYELETPTEELLSPEAQKALHSIMATDEQTELTIVGIPADAGISNQFLVPHTVSGATSTTALCLAKKNEIDIQTIMGQTLNSRINKLEIDNQLLSEQTLVVE